jgi:hypothetical protein
MYLLAIKESHQNPWWQVKATFYPFFIIPLVPYNHFFPFSSCMSMHSNRLAHFLTFFFINFFIYVLFMLLLLVLHASPLHFFCLIKLLNLYSIIIVVSLHYASVIILFSLVVVLVLLFFFRWCLHWWLHSFVATLDHPCSSQNHNKPRLLLFQNIMKFPPSTTTIFSFATIEKTEA